MDRVGTPRIEATRTGLATIQRLRDSITAAAAVGYLSGGALRLAASGPTEPQATMLGVLCLPLGAVAAAISAGILVNLIVLPAIGRMMPGHRLPRAAYRVAGGLSALAAFATALAIPPVGP